MELAALDQSSNNIGVIVGAHGGANSILYAYLGGTGYTNAALYAHPDKSVSINKTSVTSGYTLDVNGAIQSTGLKIGTLSGLLKASSGVVGTAVSGTDVKTIATNSILGSGSLINITISTTEPTGGTYYNGDIWVES